jgi:probable F420-dependent oxidoreductase
MRIGVAFPTTEIGNDSAAIRDFVQAVEDLGYDHLTTIDHVLQAGPSDDTSWHSYYERHNPFHEQLVLLGFIAAVTRRIGLVTAILILPQRPTVLVAKQAAEIDLLSGGRLRLGVGLGWNKLEFDALGQNFHDRGRRMEEQIILMRRLWTEELISFDGDWHRIDNAGINPLPVQQPIPVWIGAFAKPAIERAGRLADGWFVNPTSKPDDTSRGDFELLREAATAAGRNPKTIGIEATIQTAGSTPDDWITRGIEWQALGANYLTVRTMRGDLPDVDAHIDILRRFKEDWPGHL